MKRYMRCPYCEHVFGVSELQQAWNMRFKCPKCKKYNAGSITASAMGILEGMRLEDYRYLGGI